MKGGLGTESHGEEDSRGPKTLGQNETHHCQPSSGVPYSSSGRLWTLGRWKLRVTREEVFKHSGALLTCKYKRGLG